MRNLIKFVSCIVLLVLALAVVGLFVDIVNACFSPDAYRFGMSFGDDSLHWSRESLANYIVSGAIQILFLVIGIIISYKIAIKDFGTLELYVFLVYAGGLVLVFVYTWVT